ncbi:MAG: glycosyltransferase [Candidatus Rickettsia vulgarisii]
MNILVISAHSLSLDRRIISQINALAQAGYNVTLLSVPVYDDCLTLIDSRVNKVMLFIGETKVASQKNYYSLRQYARKYLPELVLMIIRLYRTRIYFYNYFLTKVPYQNYDVIHAHDLTTLPAAVAIKRSICPNSKIIYDAHELYPYQFTSKIEENIWIKFEKKYLSFVDKIIAVNESCKTHFEKKFLNCPPVDVIYNSYSLKVKENNVQDIKQYFKNKELPIFIFQGGMSSGRNLINMVTAFAQISGICNLLILGRGDILHNLQQVTASYNAENIFFMNWVAQDKLPGILKQVNFGIIPYTSDNKLNNLYCTPNKLFEFISFRIPILANDLPEMHRIINKYQIGLVSDLTSVENIKEAVKNIIIKKFQVSNFIHADNDLGWKAQEKVLLTIYNNLSEV